THGLDGVDVAALDELDDVLARLRGEAGLLEVAGEGGPGGECLEAAAVAARARHLGSAGDVDVAEVAGGALGAALQEAAGDDACADAGGDLHEDEVVDVGPGVLALAEGHDVDVVVDEHGRVEAGGESPRHVVVVPARHDRRVDGAPGGVFDGAGQPDPDREQVARGAVEGGEQALRLRGDPAQHRLGPLGDAHLLEGLGEHAAGEVAHPDAHVRGADVDAEDDAAARGDGELGGGAAAGGDRVADGGDQPELHERVDADGDGGAREPRH